MSFYKNGVVSGNKFSETVILENMEQKVLPDCSSWAKIFEHNNKTGTVFFTTIAEVLNTQTENKYSRLYLIDTFKGSDNKLELMLEYPDDLPNKYNRWKQTNAPQSEFVAETSAGTGTATGYEAIHCDWTGSYWGGLTRQYSDASTIPSTTSYLSGSVGHGNWWYALGAFKIYGTGIPGPGSVVNGRVQIWVRTDLIPQASKMQISKNSCIVSNSFYEI